MFRVALCAFVFVLRRASALILRVSLLDGNASSATDVSSNLTCDVDAISERCKPAFQLIGVQKSGTSTIYQLMKQHPSIEPAIRKELLWFNGNYETLRCKNPGTPTERNFSTDYLEMFPKLKSGSDKITGEWSATYFHCSCCPTAFKRLMPNVRLIVLLRDPISRAISRYDEQKTLADWNINNPLFALPYNISNNFDDFVNESLPDLQQCLDEADLAHDLDGIRQRRFECAGHHNILGLSLYAAALDSWKAEFEKLLVLYTDDLESKPQKVMMDIETFLGVPSYTYEGIDKVYNHKGNYGWGKELQQVSQPSVLTLDRLRAFYMPSVMALREKAKQGIITPLPQEWIAKWSLE